MASIDYLVAASDYPSFIDLMLDFKDATDWVQSDE